jgi:tetratricopeptide (TPR) repeat protein
VDAIDRGDRREERKAFDQARGAIARGDRAVEAASRAANGLAEVDLYRGYLRAVEGDLHEGSQARTAAYRAAEAAFDRAVVRDPDLVEGWAGLGDVRYRTGDLRGALEAWLAGVKLAPSDAYLRESLGVALHQIGRRTEAAEQYEEAARLDTRRAQPLTRLGDVLADAEKWGPALDAYRRALARDATAIEAYHKSAVVLEHLGRLSEARVAYERYASEGGEHAAAARRRVERLLRAEEGR